MGKSVIFFSLFWQFGPSSFIRLPNLEVKKFWLKKETDKQIILQKITILLTMAWTKCMSGSWRLFCLAVVCCQIFRSNTSEEIRWHFLALVGFEARLWYWKRVFFTFPPSEVWRQRKFLITITTNSNFISWYDTWSHKRKFYHTKTDQKKTKAHFPIQVFQEFKFLTKKKQL